MADAKPVGSTVAVIGAGVIGCAVAWALAREGRRVLLLDRAEPATAGASFGNVGHIATEQVETLPSKQLLFGFWRELFALDGALDIPLHRLPALSPWIACFAVAAFRQEANTRHLAPLVRGAADALERLLSEVGRRDLLRRKGHYTVWFGAEAHAKASREAANATRLEVRTAPAPAELLRAVAAAASASISPSTALAAGTSLNAGTAATDTSLNASTAATGTSLNAGTAATDTSLNASAAAHGTGPNADAGAAIDATSVAGLWHPDSAHVLDPAEVARSFASAAIERGAVFQRANVRELRPCPAGIEIVTDTERLTVGMAVVCAGVWSPELLAPFGLRAPLEAERGYHVELTGHAPLVDAPLVYADRKVVVTPMTGRLRGSSYLEFAGRDAPPDPRKPARLRAKLRALGYRCDPDGPSWMGPRPTLPDYLPGIGRARDTPHLLYAIGHQHLGLTLAAPTAELIADLVAERTPRLEIRGFDLRRFGARRHFDTLRRERTLRR